MTLIMQSQLVSRINSGTEAQIYFDPLLSESQIGAVSVDLRLGCDFLVSVEGGKPSVVLHPPVEDSGPEEFYQAVRRDLGDRFLVHPSRTVLATSLEYIGLPLNVYADVTSRSSFQRLGFGMFSMVQPGFRGCVSIELSNHSNVPVELIVGSRIAQARFFEISQDDESLDADTKYKYVGNVRPVASKATSDEDLGKLVSSGIASP